MKLAPRATWVALSFAASLHGAVAVAQQTTRTSVDSAGVQGNNNSAKPALSGDGRIVVFASVATNLVAGDNNLTTDVFAHDTRTGVTERISESSTGGDGNFGGCAFVQPQITPDGRYVAFASYSTNLVAGGTIYTGLNVFVRDRHTGTTELVSGSTTGTPADNDSGTSGFAISDDGRFVVFSSFASDLVSGVNTSVGDVFLRDRALGTTTLVSVDSSGNQGDRVSGFPAISADGKVVAFISIADNLAAGDVNGWFDAFVRDLASGVTTCVSVDSSGVPGDIGAQPAQPSLSADGGLVAFSSISDNLVASDTNGAEDVFVRDVAAGTTELDSVDSSGVEAAGYSGAAAITPDGGKIAFWSTATNLVPGDTNNCIDVFVHDRRTGATSRVSVDSSGVQENGGGLGIDDPVAITADGRFVAFASIGTNLVASDTNNSWDVFVHGSLLTLETSESVAHAGDTLTFDSWTGLPSGTNALAIVAVGGAPLFVIAVLDAFDANGRWTTSATVPSGLAGLDVTFEEFGIVPSGKVGTSNTDTVSFQ
jgi:Tol biopolymer transport system component